MKKEQFVKTTTCRCCSVAKSRLTLCDPMDCNHQAPLSMGFPWQEHWSGLLLPLPGDLPDPGIKPVPLLRCQAGSLPLSHWEAPKLTDLVPNSTNMLFILITQCLSLFNFLYWRIPGTGEPGGLPSMGSQSRTRLKRLSSSSSSSRID